MNAELMVSPEHGHIEIIGDQWRFGVDVNDSEPSWWRIELRDGRPTAVEHGTLTVEGELLEQLRAFFRSIQTEEP